MRLTTRTNLALRTLMVCAVNPERIVRKSDVAQAINASENHLAQVVNQLGQAGFITTLRGRHGGFSLAIPADKISVGKLFRIFESDLPFMECFTDDTICPLKGVCRVSSPLHRAIEAFYAALDPVMLSELVTHNAELDALLELNPSDRLRDTAPCTAARRAAS